MQRHFVQATRFYTYTGIFENSHELFTRFSILPTCSHFGLYLKQSAIKRQHKVFSPKIQIIFTQIN